jgi:hypothetical protein
MTGKAGKDIGIDQRIVRLASDTVRHSALNLLNERSADTGEVAAHLELSPEEANKLLGAMVASGLIEVINETPRRGVVKPRYRAVVKALWSDEEWAALSLEERRRLSAWVVQMINSDIAEAMKAGTFDARPDRHSTRTISLLDEQGWRDIVRIHAETLETSFAIQAESAERLAESGEEGISVLSVMICCELPLRRWS